MCIKQQLLYYNFIFFCFSPYRAAEVQLAAFSIPSISPASAWPSDHGSVQNPHPQSPSQSACLYQCLVQLRTIPEPLAKPQSRRLQHHGERQRWQRQQRPEAVPERDERTRQRWSRYGRSPPQQIYHPGKTLPPVCFSFRSAEPLSLVGESGEYLDQDAYLEEDELIAGEDVLSDVTINSNRPQVKRRRLYRVPRERQRGSRTR